VLNPDGPLRLAATTQPTAVALEAVRLLGADELGGIDGKHLLLLAIEAFLTASRLRA
jgi:hypothetical protein